MMAQGSIQADRGPGPLFVVGMWRSGTSLLYSLLNQHPQIALMYEADLFLLRPLFSSKGSNPDWRMRWEFWNSALSRHHIPLDRIPAEVPDLPTAAMAVWKEYAGLAAVVGEKSPNCYDSLQELAAQFPGARFLVIWRDIADVCRSIIQASKGSSFFSRPGTSHRAIIGCHKLKQECDALVRRNIPLHQIQYEEMVKDSTTVMAGICRFLEIPFDARMCSLEGSDRSAIYEGSHHKHVKGETILSSKERPEVLPLPLKAKIDRYVCHWKRQYGGKWPQYPKLQDPGVKPAGAGERVADEVLFHGLRALDRFTAFVYCYAPFSWLNAYRRFKNRRYSQGEAAGKAAQPATSPAKKLPQVEVTQAK